MNLRRTLESLRRIGCSDRMMRRLVRAVRESDAAARHEASLPRWKVWVLVRGGSDSVIVHAPDEAAALRSAVRMGYDATGLVTPVRS